MKTVPPNILKYAGDVPAFLAVFPKSEPGLPLVNLHRIVQGVRPISKQTLLQLIGVLVEAGVLVKSCVDGSFMVRYHVDTSKPLPEFVAATPAPAPTDASSARVVPAWLAIKIMEALHVPPYEGLTIKGEPLRLMLQHRIEHILEKAFMIPDEDATWRLRLRLDSILAIIAEKEEERLDLEIGSTAFKSIRHWADWRADK